MALPYTPPHDKKAAFNCPRCHAYAQQNWIEIYRRAPPGFSVVGELKMSQCTHCKKYHYWHNGVMFDPDVQGAPPPNEDLDKDIQRDYNEASSIVSKSPRGAASLLRLCIQKLCKQLGEKGKNIDGDIGALVRKGLDVRIQQALDTVRVIGNEAVHPGEMDLRDDVETAGTLFSLVNAIADQMITQPKLRDALYEKLPQAKRQAIDVRDNRSKRQPPPAVAADGIEDLDPLEPE